MYCGNVCVGAIGVPGDQLDPVSQLPPTVMLLDRVLKILHRYLVFHSEKHLLIKTLFKTDAILLTVANNEN